jgi:hypothetical protein
MRITNAGNVGIGTSSPIRKFNVYDSADSIVGRIQSGQSSSWLQFAASGTGTASRIGSPDGASIASIALMTNDTERMRIDSSGNVGIGTTSPNRNLQVGDGSGSSEVIAIVASNTGSSQLALGDSDDDNRMQIIADHSVDKLGFQTGGGGGIALSKMIIDSSGNVGIGTSSPTGQLQIYNASGTGGIRLTRLDNITDINMHLQTNSTSTLLNFYGDAVFRTNVKGDGTNAIERMRIDSSGDVLVATTTNGSKAKLHAEGSMGIGAERFDTHEIGKGASGTFTTITTTFTTTSSAGSVIVEALMTGYSGVYLDHVIGKYSTQANVVMRNNGSGGTTVTLTESSSVYTHTITTSVLHPVVKYKITVGGLAFFTVAPTITFA